MPNRMIAVPLLTLALCGLVVACGDDGEDVRSNELVDQALVEYKEYVLGRIDATIAATTEFTDAVRSGELEEAKELYAPSRQGWESIEPVPGLVEEIDGAVDARVDDFEGEDDPAFTGWHRIEHILWELDTTDGAAEFADGLDEDLQDLQEQVEGMDIPAAALVVGAADLTEEDKTAVQATLAGLSENLALMAGRSGSNERRLSGRPLPATVSPGDRWSRIGGRRRRCPRRVLSDDGGAAAAPAEHGILDFRGPHQAGITARHQAAASWPPSRSPPRTATSCGRCSPP